MHLLSPLSSSNAVLVAIAALVAWMLSKWLHYHLCITDGSLLPHY